MSGKFSIPYLSVQIALLFDWAICNVTSTEFSFIFFHLFNKIPRKYCNPNGEFP